MVEGQTPSERATAASETPPWRTATWLRTARACTALRERPRASPGNSQAGTPAPLVLVWPAGLGGQVQWRRRPCLRGWEAGSTLRFDAGAMAPLFYALLHAPQPAIPPHCAATHRRPDRCPFLCGEPARTRDTRGESGSGDVVSVLSGILAACFPQGKLRSYVPRIAPTISLACLSTSGRSPSSCSWGAAFGRSPHWKSLAPLTCGMALGMLGLNI